MLNLLPKSLHQSYIHIMPQLMLQQVLCEAIEKIINKALSMNAGSNSALDALDQKTLALKLDELGFILCLSVNEGTVLVTKLNERADCTIITSINTLKTLKQEQQLTQLIKQGQLDVEGDIKVAQHFASLAENLHIDWQTECAKYIGDVATYKLVQCAETVKNKARFASEQIKADSTEWLVHEQRLVVTKSQIDNFNQAVSAAAIQTDKIEHRLNQLIQQFSAKG